MMTIEEVILNVFAAGGRPVAVGALARLVNGCSGNHPVSVSAVRAAAKRLALQGKIMEDITGGMIHYSRLPSPLMARHLIECAIARGLDAAEAAGARERSRLIGHIADSVGRLLAPERMPAQRDCLELAIDMLHARRVVDKGEHTFAYFDQATEAWWLVTDAAMRTLGVALDAAKGVDVEDVINTWAQADTTGREVLTYECHAMNLPR